jgi:hypothetical protein
VGLTGTGRRANEQTSTRRCSGVSPMSRSFVNVVSSIVTMTLPVGGDVTEASTGCR